MSTPHDGLGTASGEGQGQRLRRALFDTVLRHGSEERMSTPPSGVDNQTPRSPSPAEPDHVVTINPRVIQPERSAEHVPAEPTEHAWTRTHIDQWSHVTTIEFLEHFMINTDSLQTALQLKWTGRTLREIVQSEDYQAIISEDLGITNRMHRITIVAAIKAGMEFQSKPSGTTTTGTPQTKQTLLAGEKALSIPTIPKGAPGQALPNQSSWKVFMTATQGWADLASKDYSYIIDKLKQNPEAIAQELYSHLQDDERRIDQVLGTHLFTNASADLQKLFTQQQDYSVTHEGDTKLSGLAIISYLGQKIVSKCTTS